MLPNDIISKLELPPEDSIQHLTPNDAHLLFDRVLRIKHVLNEYSHVAFQRYWRSSSGIGSRDQVDTYKKLADAIARKGINIADIISSLNEKNKS